MGQFFLGESQSRLYPHMRAKFGRGPTVVSKKGRLTVIIDVSVTFGRETQKAKAHLKTFCIAHLL